MNYVWSDEEESQGQGAPCDCNECTCEEPAEDVPEEIEELDNLDVVDVDDAPAEVEQEEHTQPEATFEEQFAF